MRRADETKRDILYSRLGSMLLFALIFSVSHLFFSGPLFSSDVPFSERSKQLQLRHVDDNKHTSITTPQTWDVPVTQDSREMEFAVEIPREQLNIDSVLVVSAYRHTIEVWDGERRIARAGSSNKVWMHPAQIPLIAPLSAAIRATDTESNVELRLKIETYGAGPGGIGNVWLTTESALDYKTKFQAAYETIHLSAIAVIAIFIVFFAIDAKHSHGSIVRFALSVPTFLFIALSLPELDFLAPLLWFKLYKFFLTFSALAWGVFALRAFPNISRWVSFLLVLVVVGWLPTLLIDDPHTLTVWFIYGHDLLAALFGFSFLAYVLLFAHRAQDKLGHFLIVTVGAILSGSGIHDFFLLLTNNPSMHTLTLSFATMLVAFVLLCWMTWELVNRSHTLEQHQQHLQKLVNKKTQSLEKTQIELLRHQRLNTLNLMGATISHEVRNPLGAINNDLELLRQQLKRMEFDSSRPLERMRRNVDRINHTVTELSDYSKRLESNKQNLDISQWLDELVCDLKASTSDTNIRWESSVKPELFAHFDPEQLRRAVVNVVENSSNALVNSQQPTIQLTLSQRAQQIELTVSDNGHGFQGDNIESNLEPLVSSNNSGLGLGLAVVKDILQVHQGDVSLRNSANGGALVTMTLPSIPFDKVHAPIDKR